jgi:hypothetical protein
MYIIEAVIYALLAAVTLIMLAITVSTVGGLIYAIF